MSPFPVLPGLGKQIWRVLRMPQTLLLSAALPAGLYLVFSHVGSKHLAGLSPATYTMISMGDQAVMGTVMFTLAWLLATRTPAGEPKLPVLALGTWLAALPAMAAVYLVAVATGVRLPAANWVEVLTLTWLAALPFVMLGTALGFAPLGRRLMPAVFILFVLLSILGGLWMPSELLPAFLRLIGRALPSYWLGMAGRSAAGAPGFTAAGALVLLGWSLALIGLTGYGARRRHTPGLQVATRPRPDNA